VTFNPEPTFTGTATPIKYVVADSTGQIAAATIAVTVVAPPSPTYQLSYNLGGGTGTTPTTVTGLNQGDTTALANDSGFTKTGYTFTGWNCDNSIGAQAAGSTATQPAANVICTAQWTAVVTPPSLTYQLSYNLGGGTGTTPTTVTDLNQNDITALADDSGFSKTGFTFAGWNCDNSIGAKAAGSTATQPAADVVCTAQWTAVVPAATYQLSYNLGGGTGTTPSTVTGLNQGNTTTIATGTGLTKTGFTFAGWNCDNSIGAKAAGSTATQPAANVVCTARWTAVAPSISLPTTGVDANLTLQIAILALMIGFVWLLVSHGVQRRRF
jgi:uncharacterized repeat protein (TIGR02543 family)